ncbi:MAG: DUF4232 domain-containing protein [Dehalococcoidia bacterium]
MRRIALLVPLVIAAVAVLSTAGVRSAASAHAQTPGPALGGGLIPYPAGWNLLAGFPGLGGAQTVAAGATGPLYTFQAGDMAYEAVPNSTPLVAGRGYWAYFAAPTSVRFPRLLPVAPPLSLSLPAGQFIMIGDPFATDASVSGADSVYVYDQQHGYQATIRLQAGQGAWAFSAAGATITIAMTNGGGTSLDRCHTSQLVAAFVTSEGAAGHIFDTFSLTNASSTACTLFGFVGGQMLDAAGAALPTRVVRNGGMFSNQPGPTQFELDPGAAATFMLVWSDVPTGNETTCPAAAQLEITPPDETDFLVLNLQRFALAPCNGGTLDITPVRPPARPAASPATDAIGVPSRGAGRSRPAPCR